MSEDPFLRLATADMHEWLVFSRAWCRCDEEYGDGLCRCEVGGAPYGSGEPR